MFRLTKTYYRSYELMKKECKAKHDPDFDGPPEENYPIHPQWAERGDYKRFHNHILGMLNIPEEEFETAECPPLNVKFIEPCRGLVPGNLRLVRKGTRLDSARRLVNDIQEQRRQSRMERIRNSSNADDSPSPRPSLNPSMLSGTLISNNTSHVLPRPRMRRFSANFCDKNGNINPMHTARDADETSAREYHLSGRLAAAPQGIDRVIEQEHCNILNNDYGTDNLDVLDRIFRVFGKVEDPNKPRKGPEPDHDFNDKIQQLIAKRSKDPEVRKRAMDEIYRTCSEKDCYNLEAEQGLCIRHLMIERMEEDMEKKKRERELDKQKNASKKPKPYKETRFLLTAQEGDAQKSDPYGTPNGKPRGIFYARPNGCRNGAYDGDNNVNGNQEEE